MAIVRINSNIMADPALRPLIHKLKNLQCLTQDQTLIVKEYSFESEDFGRNELVEIKFKRDIRGKCSIEKIIPILNPEDNIPTISIQQLHDERINPFNPNVDRMGYADRVTKFLEFIRACGRDYGFEPLSIGPDQTEIQIYMNQTLLKVNRVDEFIAAHQVFITPNHPEAPMEEPATKKAYVVLRGKAAGNTFWTINNPSRRDWFERILETDSDKEAIEVCRG